MSGKKHTSSRREVPSCDTATETRMEIPRSLEWRDGKTETPPCGLPIIAFVFTRNGRELGLPVGGVVQTDYTANRPYMRESYTATRIPLGDIARWIPARDALGERKTI